MTRRLHQPANHAPRVSPQEDNPARLRIDAQGEPVRKPHRTLGLALIAVIVVAVIAMSFSVRTPSRTPVAKAAALPAVVEITARGFVPAAVTVSPGQAVTWINEDSSPHQPATDPYPLENALAGFRAASPLLFGQSYSFAFTRAGTFTYHDHLNPFKLTGSVIVQ